MHTSQQNVSFDKHVIEQCIREFCKTHHPLAVNNESDTFEFHWEAFCEIINMIAEYANDGFFAHSHRARGLCHYFSHSNDSLNGKVLLTVSRQEHTVMRVDVYKFISMLMLAKNPIMKRWNHEMGFIGTEFGYTTERVEFCRDVMKFLQVEKE